MTAELDQQQELPPPPAGYTVSNDAAATQLPPPPAGYEVTQPAPDKQPTAITDTGEQGPYRTTPEGTPVYQTTVTIPAGSSAFPAAPAMPQGRPPEPYSLPKQIGSGLELGVGAVQGLASKSFNILDSLADQISKTTGQSKGGLFRDLADYWAQQEQQSQQEASKLAGGRRDFWSQLTRAPFAAIPMLPALMTGAGAAEYAPGLLTGTLGTTGSALGMIGAIENSDRGWQSIVQGAGEGALMGKFMDVLGPLKTPYRLTGVGLYTYAQDRLHGVDEESALANAITQMGFSGLEHGQKQTEVGAGPPRSRPIQEDVSPASRAAQQVIEQGKQYGVRLSAGDVSQNPFLKNMEVSAEKVPGVGMGKFRAGQQVEAKEAAEKVRSQLEDALIEAEPSSLEDLRQAAEGGDQRARNVLEKMNSAGNDPDRVIQASIGLGDWTTRQQATELYDKVQKLAEDHNLGDVPMKATSKAIGSSLAELRPAKLPNKEVIGLLAKIKESISPKVDEEGQPLRDAQGNEIGPNNTYGLIRQLHSDLGDRIREYYQGNNALIGEKGVGHLERVQNALEDDMRNYAKDSGVPEIVDAGEAADQYYRSARVPYKNGMLAAAATSSEPDQVFQQFIQARKGDRAENFYKALDDRGKAAVRYNMVAKAIDDATNSQSGVFSPQKFFTSVDKLDKAYGVFFNARDKAEIQGFKNLMGHVTRAGQYAENPPTGQRAIPIILGLEGIHQASNIAAHPILAGAGLGLIVGARGLFTTVKGRNLLLRMSGIKPGTPIMNSMWQQIGRQMLQTSRTPEQPPAGGTPPEEPPAGPPAGGGAPPPAAPAGGAAPALPKVGETIEVSPPSLNEMYGRPAPWYRGVVKELRRDPVTGDTVPIITSPNGEMVGTTGYWRRIATQPPAGAPGAPGTPPPAAPGGAPAAPGAPAETPTPSLGEKIKGAVKKFWEDEEGSLTIRNLRKADRAAGSEQSTRVPTAVKATEDPLSNILTTGYKSWTRDPEMLRKNVNAMLEYPNFGDLKDQVKSGKLSIPDAAEKIIGRIQENLQWLHDSMPENFRDRARLWYDGAHTIARKWAGDYKATPEQVAASMAVTSPGTDWFVNAERARRLLEFWQDRGSKKWDPRMETTWRDKISKAVPEQARDQIYQLIKGKSFKQVAKDPDIAPIWFRLYDEAVNPREYPTLTPEGKAGDLARVGSGDPRQFSWSDFGQIGKVLSILEDGSRENIHQQLGKEHKVRNFYNNIINPDSPREHTTIDTHAVAAGLARPLSQMSTEVGHNFGGAGSSSSSISGESGTYALHKEAYRRAAAANGLLPREMQSITWEAIRSMFSPQFKRNPANVEYINSLWRDVSSGKITADAARQRALQFAGGFDRPAWFKGRWNPAVPKAAKPSGKSR